MNNGNRLQCRDMIERNFWWGLFVGMFMGCYMTSRLRYGDMLSPQRRFRVGLSCSLFLAAASFPITWFLCPLCQLPNQAALSVVTREQAFKNYIDKKYNLYENCDK